MKKVLNTKVIKKLKKNFENKNKKKLLKIKLIKIETLIKISFEKIFEKKKIIKNQEN